ncbi:heavy metal sensor histidine kinase [Gallaecimonas mangrovi]|uniref:heavy metal sensor histidine kinase n=1 Tax=Gallaecimonas mangrovi TaxID=2291597 RepID=UPI00186696CD|nr:heavy metal sensor histidine kinase [Gallaecimonas mangrovi]
MTKMPASLARRVMLLVGLTIVLCLLLLGWVIQTAIEQHFADMDSNELQNAAQPLLQVIEHQPPNAADLDRTLRGLKGISFTVLNQQGQALYRTQGPDLLFLKDDAKPTISRQHLRRFRQQGHTYRATALAIPASGAQQYRLLMALNIDIHQHFLNHFHKTLWGIMAGAALVTILAAWLAVRWGHAPLRALSNTIRTINSDQLSTRLDPQQVPKELQELVDAFNGMLSRLEDLFERLSNFSADIAHELRTPITNLSTQTQVALGQARSDTEYKEILYSNLEEFERLAKMVTDMLWLAQTDNGKVIPHRQPLKLRQELEELCDYFELLAEDCGVKIDIVGDISDVSGDKQLIRRALSNYISNAIRHTASGQTITLSLEETASKAWVHVTNPGITIAKEHLAHLFERFYRVDPARGQGGVGLGLAIVKSIARLHGGDVAVSSFSQQNRFSLWLPRKH